MYFHGGSNVLGSPQTALSLTAALVARTRIRALSLDYRLAPEHPFPAGFEDALAAYRELLGSGIEPRSIAFAGDSAGGGTAVVTCLMARDADLPRPAAVVAFSPGLDMTRTGSSMDTKEGIDPFFTRASLEGTAAMYLAGADPDQELLTPATRADMTGFPRCCCRPAPTRSSSTTRPAWPPGRETPGSTSSWTSRPASRTCSRPSPGSSTRPTRR